MSRYGGMVYMSNKKALIRKMVIFEEEEDVGVQTAEKDFFVGSKGYEGLFGTFST